MFKKSLSYPHLVWMVLFVIAPMFLIFFYALTITNDGGEIRFTLTNFAKFFEPIYFKILFNSIWIAFLSVIFCILLGILCLLTAGGWIVLIILIMIVFRRNKRGHTRQRSGCGCSPLGWIVGLLGLGFLFNKD